MNVHNIIYQYAYIYVQSTASMPSPERLQVLGAEEEI